MGNGIIEGWVVRSEKKEGDAVWWGIVKRVIVCTKMMVRRVFFVVVCSKVVELWWVIFLTITGKSSHVMNFHI